MKKNNTQHEKNDTKNVNTDNNQIIIERKKKKNDEQCHAEKIFPISSILSIRTPRHFFQGIPLANLAKFSALSGYSLINFNCE